jgi:hypothetical protein
MAAARGGRRDSANLKAQPAQTVLSARQGHKALSAGAQEAAAAAAGRQVAGAGYSQWWSYKIMIHTAAAPAEEQRRSCCGF